MIQVRVTKKTSVRCCWLAEHWAEPGDTQESKQVHTSKFAILFGCYSIIHEKYVIKKCEVNICLIIELY